MCLGIDHFQSAVMVKQLFLADRCLRLTRGQHLLAARTVTFYKNLEGKKKSPCDCYAALILSNQSRY